MWEISIITSSINRHYLFEIKKKLNLKFKKDNILLVCEKINNNHILSVATNKNEIEVKNEVKILIATKILEIYKEPYFENKIKLNNISDACRTAFIKALVCFDYDNDINLIYNELNIKSVNLEAFYKFKLLKLRKKWDDLIEATSYETIYSNNYEIFLEFLKFLIESIKPSFNEINIYFRNNQYILLDENGKKIIKEEFSKSYEDEVSLVTDLIMFAPKKINFFCENVSKDTQNLISYIFNGRVENFI